MDLVHAISVVCCRPGDTYFWNDEKLWEIGKQNMKISEKKSCVRLLIKRVNTYVGNRLLDYGVFRTENPFKRIILSSFFGDKNLFEVYFFFLLNKKFFFIDF